MKKRKDDGFWALDPSAYSSPYSREAVAYHPYANVEFQSIAQYQSTSSKQGKKQSKKSNYQSSLMVVEIKSGVQDKYPSNKEYQDKKSKSFSSSALGMTLTSLQVTSTKFPTILPSYVPRTSQ